MKIIFLLIFDAAVQAAHQITAQTQLNKFLRPWKFDKYVCQNGRYSKSGTLCGRETNFNQNDAINCARGINVNRIQRDHYIITSHSRTGAGKYLFKGNARMDIPDLTIEKFHIMEDIGPSYKFAFNQAYIGMIIWARKVNGKWYQGDGTDGMESETINIRLIDAQSPNLSERFLHQFGDQSNEATIASGFTYRPSSSYDGTENTCDWIFTHSNIDYKNFIIQYGNGQEEQNKNMIKYALNAWLADGLGDTYIDDYYLTNPKKHYFPDYIEKIVKAPEPKYSRTNSVGNNMKPSRPNGMFTFEFTPSRTGGSRMYSWSSWNDGNWADWSPWSSDPNSRHPKVSIQNNHINIGGLQLNPDQNNQMQTTRERVFPTRRVTQLIQRETTRATTPSSRPVYTRPRTTTKRPTTTRDVIRPKVRPSRPIETITVPALNPKIIANQNQVTYRECLEPGDQMGLNYRGMRDQSSRKVTCMRWDSLETWVKYHPSKYPDADLTSNFCRNPDEDAMGPWCFISLTPRKYQFCKIQTCTTKEDFPILRRDPELQAESILKSTSPSTARRTTTTRRFETTKSTTTTRRTTKEWKYIPRTRYQPRPTSRSTTSTRAPPRRQWQTTEEPFEPFLIERVTEPVVFVPVTALRTTDEPATTLLTTEKVTQLVTEKNSGNDGPELAQDCYDYFFYDDDSTEPMSTEECLSHLP